MREPKEVTRQIKQALLNAGIKSSCVTGSNWQIKIKADDSNRAREIAQDIYHRENHKWLIV